MAAATQHKWHYDMTREEAEDIQAAELLHYKKLQLRKQVNQRVAARVTAIRRNAPSNLDPSWNAIVEAGLPEKMLFDSHLLELKNKIAGYDNYPVTLTSGHKPAPMSPGEIDCTHLSSGSQSDSLPKCVQSKARKRRPTPSPVVRPPAKRPSPEACAVPAHAEVLPVARQLYVPHAHPVPRPVPATIRNLWHRADLPGRPFDAERCNCPTCPFSTGAPMGQRWNLVVALVKLENFLWYGR